MEPEQAHDQASLKGSTASPELMLCAHLSPVLSSPLRGLTVSVSEEIQH